MKERLINLIFAILIMAGVVLLFGIIYAFLPSWVYYTCLGVSVAGALWEITKPEKKRYWCFTFMEFKDGHQRIGYGVEEGNEFDFVGFYKKYPSYDIIFMKEISKKQYEELYELVCQIKKTEEGGIEWIE